MKKITIIEIFVTLIVLVCAAFFVTPKLKLTLEVRQYTKMQTNAAMMTSKILSEVSNTLNKEPLSKIASALIFEMNKIVKNPIDEENFAYSFNEECEGCVTLFPDDKSKSITLSAKDKEGNLVVRTIIQPPSYVTFNKDFKKK